MNLTEIRIRDLGRIVTGKTPSTKNPSFFEGQYPFVTPSDMEWQTYYCRDTERTVTEAARAQHGPQFIPPDSTMVTCIGNTIGKCAISSSETLTNQQINSIVPFDDVDPHFVYYLLVKNRTRIRQLGIAGGAAQPILNKTSFARTRLSVPDRRLWERIANTLKQFDDLIENNNRRIKLLEKAARLIYREWFVHLRFPGHENTRIVNGVPDGWQYAKLTDIAEIAMGQSPKSEFYNQDGNGLPFHQGVSTFGDFYPHTETYCSKPSRIAPKESILLSVRAPVGRLNVNPDEVAIGRGIAAIKPKAEWWYATFWGLRSLFHKEDIMGAGAIYAAIKTPDVESLRVLVADQEISNAFELTVGPMEYTMRVLSKENRKLQSIRDLLLPRLVSGEIEI